MAGRYTFDDVFEAPEATRAQTSTYSNLIVPDGWMSEEDNTDIFEIFGHSFTSKTKHKSLTDPRRFPVRADHPFPIRGEGLSYFEIEATNDESQDPSTTYVMIGLVGEFVELINSCPGWHYAYPSVGYNGDDGCIFAGEGYVQKTIKPDPLVPLEQV